MADFQNARLRLADFESARLRFVDFENAAEVRKVSRLNKYSAEVSLGPNPLV